VFLPGILECVEVFLALVSERASKLPSSVLQFLSTVVVVGVF